MYKVNIKNTRTGVFIVNFENISHIFSIVDFEQVNVSWEWPLAPFIRILRVVYHPDELSDRC